MEISPYLHFNGNCADAFKFYEQCLGGKITFIQKFGESPMADQVPADWRDKIMHVTMKVGEGVLMGTDASPAHYAAPAGDFRVDRSGDAGRGRAHLQRPGRAGQGRHAVSEDVLVRGFRHDGRSLRHPVDGELQVLVGLAPSRPNSASSLLRRLPC